MPPSFLLQPVPPTTPPWTRELHWACSPHGDGTEDVHKYVSLPNDQAWNGHTFISVYILLAKTSQMAKLKFKGQASIFYSTSTPSKDKGVDARRVKNWNNQPIMMIV